MAQPPPVTRSRQSTVFLAGCLLGCVLSTMLYVWMSGALYGIGYDKETLFDDGTEPALRRENLHLYLSAIGSLVSPIEKQLGRPGTFYMEYHPRKVVVRAVLTSRARLNATARIINETWGAKYKDYWLFVGGAEEIPEDLKEKHPIMQLSTMEDIGSDVERNPPLLQTFAMLKVLHKHYLNRYKWFYIVPDNTYVASREMEVMLSRMDSRQLVYMGRPGSSHPLEMAQLKLITNEFYCERGPGFVLSRTALDAIVPHLDDCLTQVSAYAQENELVLNRVDAELGRCFSRKLDTRCSSSREALSFFVNDTRGESTDPSRLWYNPMFSDLLSLHPIQDADHMRSVHHYVTAREFHTLTQKVLRTERMANEVCKTLPELYRTPATEVSDRSCSLRAFNACAPQPPLTADLLPKPFYALNKYELRSWEYFDPKSIYTSGTTIPVQDIFGESEEEVQYVLKKAVQAINHREAEEYKFQSIINGYVRYSATHGREYILDLMLANKLGRVQRRINIVRVHQPELILLPDSGPESANEVVNMIVPLSKVNERFTEFLSMYEELCLKTGERVRLILSVFGGEEDQKFIYKSVKKYAKQYPEFEYVVVIGTDAFSRGRALDLGMSVLNDTELAFLCDVDMTINQPFLNRCRMNTILGQRVYYPEFFKYYNMDYVYRFKRKPLTYRIKREHGHWATYSYGMVCIYKADYREIGGFNKRIVGWGGEDVDLFMKVLRKKLQVLKAPDPALSHRYHDKYCSAGLQPAQFQMCLSSRNEGLADRMQLAEYVLYLESKHGESGRTLWH